MGRPFGIKIISILLLVSALVLSCPGFVSYAVDTDKTVRVGYYENEVFQEGADDGAVKTGYAYEYYRKLSEYTGWQYEYVYGGYSDLYDMLLSGDIDLLAGLAKKEDRLDIIGYPELAMGNEIYTLVKHASDEDVTSDTATLSGKKIGVLKSAIADVLMTYILDHNIKAEVLTFDDYESLFGAFDSNDIDILAAEGDGAHDREYAEVICTFGTADYYLCVTKGREDLLKELDLAQSQLSADEPNFLNSLRTKYYSESVMSHNFSPIEREWIKEHNSLTVGYLKNYLPYSDTTSSGDATGIVKDLIPRIFDELGVKDVDIVYIGYDNYDDMIADAVSSKIDVAFPVGGGLYYSEESGIYQSNAVASASTDLVYKGDYDDDVIDCFAVNENNLMQYYYITTNFPEAKIVKYSSIYDCLDAVLNGDVTATTLNGLRANDILKNRHYKDLRLQQLNVSDDRCFGVKHGNEGLLKLLNRGINLVGTEYIQDLAMGYAGDLYSYTFFDLLTDYVWLFLSVIVLTALFVIIFIIRDLNRSKRASKLKSDFVSSMSHEIRTPITAILGMNELIQRESAEPEILKYSDNIKRAGESLLGIINDILDFSKIEAGRMEVCNEKYSLSELLTGLYVMAEHMSGEKGLFFSAEVDENLPSSPIGDIQMLRQVITNLLSNAVKYTREGSVKLSVRLISIKDDKMVMEVVVEDTGIGIKEEELGKLYGAFDRLDLNKTRNIEGSGLGLAIARQLLLLMDSDISVKSVYGQGSVFSFMIEQGVYDATPIGRLEDAGRSLSDGKKCRASFEAPDARILLVDDTPMNLQVISGLLKYNRMQIDTASNGKECIAAFGENDYDLVFLDQRMPGMDGIETLTEIRARYPDRIKKTPFISLTANVLAGAREEMLAAGFSDYLPKPVNIASMEEMLLKYLPEEKIQKPKAVVLDDDEDQKLSDRITALRNSGYFDVEKGLEYCGDEEDYLDAIDVFTSSAKEKEKQIRELADAGSYDELSLLIHSLKSTSRAVGAMELSTMAERIEKGLREGADDALSSLPEFLDLYHRTTAQTEPLP